MEGLSTYETDSGSFASRLDAGGGGGGSVPSGTVSSSAQTIENLKKSDQSIKFYVEKNKKENSIFNYRKNELILKDNFFDNSYEVIFRSLSDLIHLVGKKPNFVRGIKIENILNKIKEQKLRKETLGGCVIKMVNHTVILTKE